MFTVLLVCAALASLALGVLLGYGVCNAMFGLFRMHAQQHDAKRQALAAKASTAVI